MGVGYAYLFGSIPPLFGLLHGWFYVFGRASLGGLIRSVGLPLTLAVVAFIIEHAVRDCLAEITWFGLLTL
jgi:hypothetical protein